MLVRARDGACAPSASSRIFSVDEPFATSTCSYFRLRYPYLLEQQNEDGNQTKRYSQDKTQPDWKLETITRTKKQPNNKKRTKGTQLFLNWGMILKTWVGDLPLRGLVDVFKSLRARVFVHFIPVFCPLASAALFALFLLPLHGAQHRFSLFFHHHFMVPFMVPF